MIENLSKNDEIERLVVDLKNWGYSISNNVIPHETCIAMAAALDKFEEQYQLKKGKSHVSPDGQLLIRNIQDSLPEMFLPLLNLDSVWNVLCSVFNDTPILDGLYASQSGFSNGAIHIDGHLPISKFEHTTDVIVIIALDDFTEDNGATCIWPLSHKSEKRVQELKNNEKPHVEKGGGVPLIVSKGSVSYMLGQTWHQIRKNMNNQRRWGIIIHYKRWWIKPSQDFTKCGPEIYQMLSQRQKILYGFSTRPPKSVHERLKTKMDPDCLPKDYYEALEL